MIPELTAMFITRHTIFQAFSCLLDVVLISRPFIWTCDSLCSIMLCGGQISTGHIYLFLLCNTFIYLFIYFCAVSLSLYLGIRNRDPFLQHTNTLTFLLCLPPFSAQKDALPFLNPLFQFFVHAQ